MEPRPGHYGCKFRDDYPDGDLEHPKSIYVREDAILPGLDCWLASLFDDHHLDDTCGTLAGSSEPDPAAEQRETDLQDAITECDRKLDNYRALLDHEDAVTVAAKWISETQQERRTFEAQLGRQIPGGEMTTEQVKALVNALRDIVGVLADAEPVDKAELYNELGVSLRYDPDGTVTVAAHPRGVQVRVGEGGDLHAHFGRAHPHREYPLVLVRPAFLRGLVPAGYHPYRPVSRSFADILMTSGRLCPTEGGSNSLLVESGVMQNRRRRNR